ncbi:MAG: hypothetical protein KC613_24610, partial [Myxococcales bacterium]|nr:hypothetical protein [Myxococcales bacterium]
MIHRLAPLLLALGLATPARAGLDADLARFSAAPGARLVIPRLDRVLGPLGDLVQRLQQHPDWALFLGLPLSAFLARTGIDLTDPQALAHQGLKLDGPLWVHRGAVTVASLPLADGAKGAAFLATLAGLPAEPTASGWALGGLSLRHADGRMLVADAPDGADRWGGPVPPDAHAAPLAGCPRAPGEADLWLTWQSALGKACL